MAGDFMTVTNVQAINLHVSAKKPIEFKEPVPLSDFIYALRCGLKVSVSCD